MTIWVVYHKNPLFFSKPEKTWIFLLAGQSNMAGRGYVSQHELKISNSKIFTINSDLSISFAHQPLHRDKSIAGYSMGLVFAEAILEKQNDCKILLVPVALGGSSITDWQESGQAFKRAAKILSGAREYGQVKAILWHQGETESQSGPYGDIDPEFYKDKLIIAINQLRRISGNESIPFIAGSLPDYLSLSGLYPNYLIINQAIQKAIGSTINASYVNLGDLDDIGDRIHFSTISLKIMGKRYANAFFVLMK
jgi:hypothetical protein